MKKYTAFGQLPIFHQLKDTCEQIRDGIILPMKKDLEDIRDQLKDERTRLSALRSASPPAKQRAAGRVDGLHEPNGKGGPVSV